MTAWSELHEEEKAMQAVPMKPGDILIANKKGLKVLKYIGIYGVYTGRSELLNTYDGIIYIKAGDRKEHKNEVVVR